MPSNLTFCRSKAGVGRVRAQTSILDRLMAFASDLALNIYRLKGRFLPHGRCRTILLHKVGSDIAFENSLEPFETSEFVAIGTKPDFNSQQIGHVWARLTQRSNVPQ